MISQTLGVDPRSVPVPGNWVYGENLRIFEFHVVLLKMIGLENVPIVELLALYFLVLVLPVLPAIGILGNCYALPAVGM